MTRPDTKRSSVDIAYEILKRRRRPMSARELIEVGMREHGLRMAGKTPAATLNANFINERKRRAADGRAQRFVRVSPGQWGLVEYVGKFYRVVR